VAAEGGAEGARRAVADAFCDLAPAEVDVDADQSLAHRIDDALIDSLAGDRIAYVPFFPLGGFKTLQSSTLSGVAQGLGAPANAGRACVARFAVRHRFLSFRARRRWRIFERTSPRRGWIYQTR